MISMQPEGFLNQFLNNQPQLLIDTRSEKEYEKAHIPGAVNIPLLNNEHRHLVGIAYKKKGREEAVGLGFELVGPLFAGFINQVKGLTNKRHVSVYCWRGGMRSNIFSWVLSLAGYKVNLLEGGYKNFRSFVLQSFLQERNYLILSGNTGSGKTSILKELSKEGEQILDLEALANHRGSAFGHLGLPPQPSNEFFENLIAVQLFNLNKEKRIWVESESRNIGRNKIPDHLFDKLRCAALIELEVPREKRIKNILNEYGHFPVEDLKINTEKIQKKLGGLRFKNCVQALLEGRKEEWVNNLLDYYDENYAYSVSLRQPQSKNNFSCDSDDYNTIAKQLIQFVNGR